MKVSRGNVFSESHEEYVIPVIESGLKSDLDDVSREEVFPTSCIVNESQYIENYNSKRFLKIDAKMSTHTTSNTINHTPLEDSFVCNLPTILFYK